MHHFLDIRFDIGLILAIIGSILLITGLVSTDDARLIAGTLNVNLAWGIVLILAGAVFFWAHHRNAEEYGS